MTPARLPLFLCIDGGGTGCRAVLADGRGEILGHGTAGPANIASDFEGALGNIVQAAREAAGEVSLTALRAGLGLAGANAGAAADRLRPHLPFARSTVVTDAETAALGALGDSWGIVGAIGTGSVYARRDGAGLRQIGGRGLAVGDEASGAWLGKMALSRALRAADGLTPGTPFLSALIARFGGVDAAVAWAVTARGADFATLAPEIVASRDPAALALMEEATAEVNAAITALQPSQPLPVVLIGGLGPVFAPRIAAHWTVRPAVGSALDGALALARQIPD